MKRIQFALVAVMLCASVSACKRDEPPAPAAEAAPVDQAAMPAAVEPAPVESVAAPMPAATDDVPQTGGDKVGTKPAPAATENDDAPQSGGDKVGG